MDICYNFNKIFYTLAKIIFIGGTKMNFLLIVLLLGICWIYLIPTTISYLIIRKTFSLFNKLYPLLNDKDLRKKEFKEFGDMNQYDYIQLENLISIKKGAKISDIAKVILKQITSNLNLLELLPIWDSSTRSNYEQLLQMQEEITPLLENKQLFIEATK